MQAFTSPYVCPYFTCSSPYCIALRNSAVASSLQSVSRPPTSISQPGISSFTISSILSRSDEQTNKTSSEETISSKSPSTETSLSIPKFSPHTSHVSIARFHPYHRPLATSAFSRTTCSALQKGKLCDKLDITHLSRAITPYSSHTILSRWLFSQSHLKINSYLLVSTVMCEEQPTFQVHNVRFCFFDSEVETAHWHLAH